MRVLKPITFQNSHLISSSATETVAAWSSATGYTTGQTARYVGKIWESINVGTNTNHQPDTSPTWWLEKGPDNQHAMFDNQINTMTTATSPLVVVIKPLIFFNSIAFVGLTGTSINVTITDGDAGPEIYNQTKSLDGTVIDDWYDYFFEPFDTLDTAVFLNIPTYLNARVTVTITGSGTVACGVMLYGTTSFIGLTQYGASASITDYSAKETDDFGNVTFVRRAFSKRQEVTLYMETTAFRFNYKLLSDLRATPSLWIGVDDDTYEPLVIYGYYKDFSIGVEYPTYCVCDLQIEGII